MVSIDAGLRSHCTKIFIFVQVALLKASYCDELLVTSGTILNNNYASMTIYGHNWHCDTGYCSEPEELNVAVL